MSKAVLLVEDVAVTAIAIADALEDAGYSTVGPFASSSEAVAFLKTAKPDFAILDVTLKGGSSVEVARELRRMEVPFLLHTGWMPSDESPSEFDGVPWLEKPVKYDSLLGALRSLEPPAVSSRS
jgi:CheY-like chemotaxis protein